MWSRKNETQKRAMHHAEGVLNCILMAKLLLLSKSSPTITSVPVPERPGRNEEENYWKLFVIPTEGEISLPWKRRLRHTAR
jgi:hypothetical protein